VGEDAWVMLECEGVREVDEGKVARFTIQAPDNGPVFAGYLVHCGGVAAGDDIIPIGVFIDGINVAENISILLYYRRGERRTHK
jgi:hypothetical protein